MSFSQRVTYDDTMLLYSTHNLSASINHKDPLGWSHYEEVISDLLDFMREHYSNNSA